MLREGDPVRWRRGSTSDSLVTVMLTRRGAGLAAANARDTVRVRFAREAADALSPALPAGTYDVRARGGDAVLVVNPSAEWVAHRPTAVPGAVGSGIAAGEAPGLRTTVWPFVVIVLLLCVEWVLRRRTGLR